MAWDVQGESDRFVELGACDGRRFGRNATRESYCKIFTIQTTWHSSQNLGRGGIILIQEDGYASTWPSTVSLATKATSSTIAVNSR